MDIEYFSPLAFRSFPNLLLFQCLDQRSFLKLEKLACVSTYDLPLKSSMNNQVVQIKLGPIQTNSCSQTSTVNESHVSRWVFQLLFLLNCRDKGWPSSKYFFNSFLWALIMRWAGPQFPSLFMFISAYLCCFISPCGFAPVLSEDKPSTFPMSFVLLCLYMYQRGKENQ